MKNAIVVPLAGATALSVLYLNFAYTFAQSSILRDATPLEVGLFVLQFGKIITIASLNRLRNMRFVNIINVLGAELIVALPGLALATAIFGDQGTSGLMTQIFLGWIAGAAAAVTPYSIYRLARSMKSGERLVFVLPAGILLSELLLLLQVGTDSAGATGQGLEGVSRTIILLGGGAVNTGIQPQGLALLIPLSVLYVSLLLHALSPLESLTVTKFVVAAGFGVMATAVTFAGTYVTSFLALPFAYVALPPIILVTTLVWWTTREA